MKYYKFNNTPHKFDFIGKASYARMWFYISENPMLVILHKWWSHKNSSDLNTHSLSLETKKTDNQAILKHIMTHNKDHLWYITWNVSDNMDGIIEEIYWAIFWGLSPSPLESPAFQDLVLLIQKTTTSDWI